MLVQSWLQVMQQSFYGLLYGLVDFLPRLVFAVVVFIIGWVIAVVVARFIAQVIHALRVDQALRSAGMEEPINRAGYRLNSGMFIGALFKWFIILIFLLASLEIMGLTQVTLFLDQVALFYLPQVIVAALILLIAAVVGQVVQNVVAGSARAAGITSAGFVGTLAKWSIWILGFMAALQQIGIAAGIINILLTGIVVALALAFGLAFGLGGQETAARLLNRMSEQMRSKE